MDLFKSQKSRALNPYVYTRNKEHIRGITQDLKKIQSIGKDKFSAKELKVAEEYSKDIFQDNIDVFSTHWLNELVGYRESNQGTERIIFYSDQNISEFNLPQEKNRYVFHTCLIDSAEIRRVGKNPVLHF